MSYAVTSPAVVVLIGWSQLRVREASMGLRVDLKF